MVDRGFSVIARVFCVISRVGLASRVSRVFLGVSLLILDGC